MTTNYYLIAIALAVIVYLWEKLQTYTFRRVSLEEATKYAVIILACGIFIWVMILQVIWEGIIRWL